ncbi:MAG TPA: bifunctional 5,10-methylenetetrahydrofolate dehydrogenase/5,10-methenyltetrahydrofolate cyclohydrolase [Longimicrobiales bacterium]
MSASLISGRDIAAEIRAEVKDRVARLVEREGLTPGLATVLVGDDPASHTYVRMKNKAAGELGLHSRQITLPSTTSEDELLGVVEGLNADPAIHGILVQSPVPGHINEQKVLLAIDPAKDVDGFHPFNVGLLATGADDVLKPCTPWGIVEMLLRSGNDPAGKHAVVVGRSNIVGRPMASLLLRKARGGNATVTVTHSRTPDLGAFTRQADILIVAIGSAETVRGDMIKPGAVVIDVGSNRIDDPDSEKGSRYVGDVAFEEAKEVASAITPVPGGVGPMTITMLLSNTVEAAVALHGVEG